MARGKQKGEKKTPVHSLEYPVHGGKLDIGIWKNPIGEGDAERAVFAISISRSYNNGKRWSSSRSLRAADIPVAIQALGKAYDWIVTQGQP